jgi:hypothetical protein
MITKLYIFDFDETLVRAPGYTCRKAVERVHPELRFPNPYSFYDHPKSLCEEIHNIQVISPVADDLTKANKNFQSKTILITHRVKELEPEVSAIIKNNGLRFDSQFYLGRVSEKSEVLRAELEENFDINEIHIYEDSFEQISKYETFLETIEFPFPVKVQYYLVDKSKVIELNTFTRGESRKIALL